MLPVLIHLPMDFKLMFIAILVQSFSIMFISECSSPHMPVKKVMETRRNKVKYENLNDYISKFSGTRRTIFNILETIDIFTELARHFNASRCWLIRKRLESTWTVKFNPNSLPSLLTFIILTEIRLVI